MKKRILSLLLVLMMVMTLMPAAALADGVTADTAWYDAEKASSCSWTRPICSALHSL